MRRKTGTPKGDKEGRKERKEKEKEKEREKENVTQFPNSWLSKPSK